MSLGLAGLIVLGALGTLIGLALIFPCEGCRLRRERIARAVQKLRDKETHSGQ